MCLLNVRCCAGHSWVCPGSNKHLVGKMKNVHKLEHVYKLLENT